MEATLFVAPTGVDAQEREYRPGWPLAVVTVGMALLAAALLLPKAELVGLQKWVLLLGAAPLLLASLGLSEDRLRSAGYRAAFGLLFVMIYLHARQAALPDGWVPKNEWDEAWRVPWVTLGLACLAPFWIACWLQSRGRGETVAAERSWTVAAALVVGTALLTFGVLRQAYPQALDFGYTLRVSLEAVEAALVFALAAAPRRALVARLLTVIVFAVVLAKATVL
ncbi:MAG: hypothetical protein COZ06_16175 [Armatimonadetes bacterium CG_4_10_14_3_um_filter_66_18]|nr:hypothetical protein [Armatimonadota bacterium]OIO98146.1 MAG: hypothetical protein AUJ96_21865 [Armatimonadetes bacterium CG2_30_66_41]PIU95255.1 MAG: hypothetical protein COS65_03430 [Armatimonadetes bacterium CG06_land_8_20_14_3_00_66_21]PIX45215.1 MAG: hypothetical protein COZ57_16060 [Armatimonadetes bacterium CG_4_8_14_3_um_filter_66_20]PIY48571.1 MAG: hypothetical protein COZ06_16175 [Armatimonadetes bacterium CG_4_10_14_3_um_filter_66_18]PIZ47239.1 MAG: hypothetical protein COY42_09